MLIKFISAYITVSLISFLSDQYDDDPLLHAGMEEHSQAGVQEQLIDQVLSFCSNTRQDTFLPVVEGIVKRNVLCYMLMQ